MRAGGRAHTASPTTLQSRTSRAGLGLDFARRLWLVVQCVCLVAVSPLRQGVAAARALRPSCLLLCSSAMRAMGGPSASLLLAAPIRRSSRCACCLLLLPARSCCAVLCLILLAASSSFCAALLLLATCTGILVCIRIDTYAYTVQYRYGTGT